MFETSYADSYGRRLRVCTMSTSANPGDSWALVSLCARLNGQLPAFQCKSSIASYNFISCHNNDHYYNYYDYYYYIIIIIISISCSIVVCLYNVLATCALSKSKQVK